MNSSISSILNVARSAIFANQTGVRITSQNIANAQTEGYSRRTIHFVESRPDITPGGRLGTGVSVQDVTRVRDELLDVTFRRETSKATGFGLREDVLGRVEQVFGEPSEEGLAATLDAFWASWSDLSSRPSNNTARRTVQQRGAQVAATLQSFDSRLDEVGQHTALRLKDAVKDVNGLAEQIARLNREIVTAEGGGHEAHDLQDQRDRLLDTLAGLGSVRVLDRGHGSIAVMVQNATIVDGPNFKKLAVESTGAPPVLRVEADGNPLDFSEGGSVMGEMVRTLNTDIPGARGRLNELATAIVSQVNALHNQGTRPGADPPVGAGDFFAFNPGEAAATIRLHADIAGNHNLVATSTDAAKPTDNQVALAMAALQGRPADNLKAQEILSAADWTTFKGSLNGASLGEYYEDLVTEVALEVSSSGNGKQVFRTIADQADARRQSVSGVSTDEELIKLMNFQQAYTAATKLVTTVDEMLQAVLNMV
jgi:flagellar hook-associated protein 1 FlgK